MEKKILFSLGNEKKNYSYALGWEVHLFNSIKSTSNNTRVTVSTR